MKLGFFILPFVFPRGHLTYRTSKHPAYHRTRRAFGKWGWTLDPLRLAEPILATDNFQNNVVININEVFGYRVTYLGIWAVAAQARMLGGIRTLYSWSEE